MDITQDKTVESKFFVKINIITVRNHLKEEVKFKYQLSSEIEKPVALDVLLQAQRKIIPDLAFRYGCRAKNCGVCTIDINGRPRIACKHKVRDGDTLSALATLPTLSDLVVKRDGISRQLRGIGNSPKGNNLNINAPDKYHKLTECIECYACLDKCPMHKKNFDSSFDESKKYQNDGYKYGNPFSLLKLERLRTDPFTSEVGREKALKKAINIGLDVCIDCPGCKCGVGINLKENVIKPLLLAADKEIKKKKI